MAKKKKLSMEERHRQIQDQVQALPYAIADLEGKGKKGKALMVRYVLGPYLRFMNRMLSKQRYGGPEGAKLKQSEKMKRHLEQRSKAMEYMQGEMRKQQKSKGAKKRGGR
jgi:hypothetical protein